MSNTRGSSVSSKAAFRYSAANSGSFRRRRIIVSLWEILALRFIAFASSICSPPDIRPPFECLRLAFLCRHHIEAEQTAYQSSSNKPGSQALQPFFEYIFSGIRDVVPNLDGVLHCNL